MRIDTSQRDNPGFRTRFLQEYNKTERRLRDWRIESTIVVFGSAEAMPADATARRPARWAHWYDEARRFGRLVSERGGALRPCGGRHYNVVATGGGGGIMEAANRGAADVGAPSIGFNIQLPFKPRPIPYTTRELTLQFHYFTLRHMHLAQRASALVAFPGGLDTLDELFDVLIQTRKAPRVPVICFGSDYWRRLINFDVFLEEKMISSEDMELIHFADDAEEAWSALTASGLFVPQASTG